MNGGIYDEAYTKDIGLASMGLQPNTLQKLANYCSIILQFNQIKTVRVISVYVATKNIAAKALQKVFVLLSLTVICEGKYTNKHTKNQRKRLMILWGKYYPCFPLLPIFPTKNISTAQLFTITEKRQSIILKAQSKQYFLQYSVK